MPLRFGLFLLLSGAQLVSAQISGLATTDDGSIVYFSSTLRLKGSDEGYTPKIFVWDTNRDTAPRLFAERKMVGPADFDPFALIFPDVSSDGAVVAYTGQKFCAGTSCPTSYRNGAVDHFSGEADSSSGVVIAAQSGTASLSRNGRFALFFSVGDPLSPGQFQGKLTRVDLSTGALVSAQTQLNPALGGGARRSMVASDGTVVFIDSEGVVFFDGARTKAYPLPESQSCSEAAIDDLASIVVCSTPRATVINFFVSTDVTSQIGVLDRSTGNFAPLVSAVEGVSQPVLSRDGKQLLFLSRANFSALNNDSHMQAFLIGTDGGNLRQITRPEDDVVAAVLSGDGRIAYASTQSNQLLKISTGGNSVQELIPPTPELDVHKTSTPGGLTYRTDLIATPGSLIWLTGSSLAPSAEGVQLLINGSPAPIVTVSPNVILAQVPWETEVDAVNSLPFTLVTPASANSPLEGISGFLQIRSLYPDFFPPRGSASTILAAHQDFQSLITAQSPAHPGEVVHIYMSGLGPVSPPVATGQAAPLTPLSLVTTPLTCSLTGTVATAPVGVLFAGLAPGTVGVYQVDVRLPGGVSSNSPGPPTILCSGATGYLPIG